jgi:lysophospholipase L1-like esterase
LASLILPNSSFSLVAQSTVQFYVTQFTGITNDTVINLTARNNPVLYHGQFYWWPQSGTNLATTNGFAAITLIPGQYNVSLAGVPQSWTLTVTNSATPLNAASLTTATLIYNGINSLTGPTVTNDGHGNYTVTPGAPPLVAGANVLITNAAGTNLVSVPAGTFDAFGAASAATGALGSAAFSSASTYVSNGQSSVNLGTLRVTNLVNDSTITAIMETNALPPGSWCPYYCDAYATNFTFKGSLLPLLNYAGQGWWYPGKIQSGVAGTNFEMASCPTFNFAVSGYTLVIDEGLGNREFALSVNGSPIWTYTTLTNSQGNEDWIQVNFATPNLHNLTFYEQDSLKAIWIPVTNGFVNNLQTRSRTLAILGDSFTEQAYAPGATVIGPVAQLQNLRPDLNIIGLGEGGTGFVNGGAEGGTNFPNRIPDVTNCNPAMVLIFGGINDYENCTNTSLTNVVYKAATNVLLQLKSDLPDAQLMLCGPQAGSQQNPGSQPALFNCATLLSNACALAGAAYLDPLTQPWITGNQSTPNSGNANQYVYIDGTHPTIPLGANYYAVQINNFLAGLNPVGPTVVIGIQTNSTGPHGLLETNVNGILTGVGFY